MAQGDLFGPREKTPRGWTELDKLRRQYATLEKRITQGDYVEKDLSEFHRVGEEIHEREQEARRKWAKSFGK